MQKAFTDKPTCDKCMSTDITMTHIVSKSTVDSSMWPDMEHLDCHCQRCHYIWPMDTASAVKKLEAAE